MSIQKKISHLFKKGKGYELKETIVELLIQEGFRPQMEEEEYICFKYESCSMYISLDEKDPMYLRIVLPNFFEVNKRDKIASLNIINQQNIRYKLGYLVMEENEVSALLDILVNKESIETGLIRGINICREIARSFCEEMDKRFSVN